MISSRRGIGDFSRRYEIDEATPIRESCPHTCHSESRVPIIENCGWPMPPVAPSPRSLDARVRVRHDCRISSRRSRVESEPVLQSGADSCGTRARIRKERAPRSAVFSAPSRPSIYPESKDGARERGARVSRVFHYPQIRLHVGDKTMNQKLCLLWVASPAGEVYLCAPAGGEAFRQGT